jgi:adenylyltransferase/sulfurtransferase
MLDMLNITLKRNLKWKFCILLPRAKPKTMSKENEIEIATLGEWGADIFPQLSWFRQEEVSAAHVMVVGCGALGNETIKNLALFGVGNLVLVDFDEVEYSNLTRSILFTQEDALKHRYKVEATAESVKRINPNINVTTIVGDIATSVGLGLLRKMNVVVGCLDNRWARYTLNRLCMRAGVPWVDGGINALEGVAKVFIPGQNCYACTLEPSALEELKRGTSCAVAIKRNIESGRVPTTPVVASIIGAVQAQEAMKLIHKEELASGNLTSLCGKMFCYDGASMTVRLVSHKAWDDDCPMHENWSPIVESPLTNLSTVAEVFTWIKENITEANAEIVLRNQTFVDFIEDRVTGEKYNVMLPESEVPAFIEDDEVLRTKPMGQFYQHTIRNINAKFTHMDLTLRHLGIPDKDVIHVKTNIEEYYIELIN